MLNTAVLAPMPMAKVKTAAIANPGDLANFLNPYRRSWNKPCMESLRRDDDFLVGQHRDVQHFDCQTVWPSEVLIANCLR
jgi:hypothetical protein